MRAVPTMRLARMTVAILLLWPLLRFHVAVVSAGCVVGCSTGQRLARAAYSYPPARRVALPI